MLCTVRSATRADVFGFRTVSTKTGDNDIVKVRQGALRGRKLRSSLGTEYYSFLGVPYAKPPVGKLRFQPPEPTEHWTGIKEVTKHGNIAPQISLISEGFRGNEDCLYLNVYTPVEGNALKPVMVWFHGGGYLTGSGNSDFNGPDFIIKQNVVLVTLNYRLGILGFLSTGDSVIPGNMGLKDQVMALQWIRDNIINFGGDPSNVTIFGGSAGGMSCEFLMLSSMGKGLFHRAISQSGVGIAGGICCPEVPERTYRLAKHLGLSTNSSNELIEKLQKIPAEVLIQKQTKGFSAVDKARLSYFPFLPTVENIDAKDGAFLNKNPVEILKSSDYSPVPYIVGFNSQEGMIYLRDLLAKEGSLENIDFDYLVPPDLANKVKDIKPIGKAIKQFYFGNKRLIKDTIPNLLNCLGDKLFVFPAVRAAKLHSEQIIAPVYLYHFAVDAGLNFFKKMLGLGNLPGACHSDEVGYLFHLNAVPTKVEPDSIEDLAVTRMTKLWTNFAKSGNPTPEDDPMLSVRWSPLTHENPKFLNISNEKLEVKENLLHDRISFWEDIYKKSGL